MAVQTKSDTVENPDLYAGVDGDSEREARRELLEHLVDAGADEAQLVDAAREDRLATLAVDVALRGDQRYTLTQVAREARLDPTFLRSVVLSLGHPNPRPRERLFSEEDLETAAAIRNFLDAGLRKDDVLAVSRVLGQSVARTAAVIREVVGNALIQPGDTEAELGMRYARAARELVPLMGSVLGYELGVHLREQATRDVITRSERERGSLTGARELAVCFTDLSQFTRLGESVPVDRVGAIGGRMAEFAAGVADRRVELVKTVGDGALFVSTEVDPLISAACAIKRRVDAEGEDFPPVRAGIAYGDAVPRGGDWFGPAVNRASRIVDIAKSGTIVAEQAVRERAGDGYEWSRRRFRRGLKGVPGRVKLYRLHADASSAG